MSFTTSSFVANFPPSSFVSMCATTCASMSPISLSVVFWSAGRRPELPCPDRCKSRERGGTRVRDGEARRCPSHHGASNYHQHSFPRCVSGQPAGAEFPRAMGTRSTDVGRGLAAVESGIGTLISFSTQPGAVALDGAGRNSPFAGSLVKHVSSSTDDLSAILIAVRNDVMKETQRKQVPWEHSSLTGRFYFGAAGSTSRPRPARHNPTQASWKRGGVHQGN